MEARKNTNRWEQERSNIDEQPWKYKLSVGLLSSETLSSEFLIVYRQSSELFSWILFLIWKTTGAVPQLPQMTGRHWDTLNWKYFLFTNPDPKILTCDISNHYQKILMSEYIWIAQVCICCRPKALWRHEIESVLCAQCNQNSHIYSYYVNEPNWSHVNERQIEKLPETDICQMYNW